MKNCIGIRREDKNIWERRVPLVPQDLQTLIRDTGLQCYIQPSPIRTFSDDQFSQAGCIVQEDVNASDLIFAVKEIPASFFSRDKTYVFFSHTIKGQDYNMDMLQRLIDLKCNLIDYERIVDEQNRRLIFFGSYAGYAGMIETLHAFGKKLKSKGIDNPLEAVKQAFEYTSVEDAKSQLKEVAAEIEKSGLQSPGIFGFAGYGNVSQAAQEIFDILPHRLVHPDELADIQKSAGKTPGMLYKVVFKEEHLVDPIEGSFVLQDYYDHPEKYVSKFHKYLPYLTGLVNCIYWTEDYPRLITNAFLAENPNMGLDIIGDISVDIEGSIEPTYKATYPDNPCYTYSPATGDYSDGIQDKGITIMAIDNLPCEFPKESSAAFSSVLKSLVPQILKADFAVKTKALDLPHAIRKALILHNGDLTEDYQYMNEFLKRRSNEK